MVAVKTVFYFVLFILILLVVFGLTTITKDILYRAGLRPPEIEITDDRSILETKIFLYQCNGGGYKISLRNVGFSYGGRDEFTPVFFFKGAVSSMGEAVKLPGNVNIESRRISSLFATLIDKKETFLLLFATNDVFCRLKATQGVTINEYVEHCSRFAVKVFSLTATLTDKQQECVETEGKTPTKEMICQPSVQSLLTNDIGSGLCEFHFIIQNLGKVSCTENDRSRIIIDCTKKISVPIASVGFLKLGPQETKSDLDYAGDRTCPKWDESKLKQLGLYDQYKDGWKIDVYKGCGYGVDDPCAEKVESRTFKC